MNIENIKKVFDNHVQEFDINEKMIKLKHEHSYRVMNICFEIAKDLELNEKDTYLAMVIGLFHDYARFEQWTKYKTYSDLESIDHGDLAVELLFENNEIEKFNINKEDYSVIYDAIKYHNKYGYPEDVSDRNKLFCKLIKDADKLDIFYLIGIGDIKVIDDNSDISKVISEEFYQEKLLKKEDIKTKSDLIVFYLAMIFDMNFKFSYKYLKDKELIEKLFSFVSSNEKFESYFKYVDEYMKEGKMEYVRKKI